MPIQMNDRLPRKLATILYADVAEYSRLTGDDEDATHRTLSEYLYLGSLCREIAPILSAVRRYLRRVGRSGVVCELLYQTRGVRPGGSGG